MLEMLQSSWLARFVGQSQMLTASLSALHLVGFTLVLGSALVSNLRLLGTLFRERPFSEVIRPAARLTIVGLCISTGTGVLLFLPRAGAASANGFFRIKLTLLVAAVVVQFAWQRGASTHETGGEPSDRAMGAAGLVLWLSAALAACAFILLE